MLKVLAKPSFFKPNEKDYLNEKNRDVIVTKFQYKTTYNEDGSFTTKRVPTMVNITKKMNEQKKLIKKDTAAEKLAELERIFSKGN